MATEAFALNRQHAYQIVTWSALNNGDDGDWYQPPAGYYLESVQYTGTIGTGPALKIQGSNEATPTNAAELATAAALGALVPSAQTLHYRPAVVGGSGTTVVAVAYFRARF